MNCSICQHPQQTEMIIDYARSGSFRLTAERFGVGYRSLHRHIKNCIYALMEENEQRDYEKAFSIASEEIRYFLDNALKLQRPRSIINKEVKFTWSRRAWKNSKTK